MGEGVGEVGPHRWIQEGAGSDSRLRAGAEGGQEPRRSGWAPGTQISAAAEIIA